MGTDGEKPEDRRDAARNYIESVGGKLHGFWYAFGSHDGLTLWEAPDNVSMAAVAIAIGGGGALSSFETTVLLTVEETLEALQQATGRAVPSARSLRLPTRLSSLGAEVAQWQSIGFVNRRLWVRLPPSAPGNARSVEGTASV